MAGLETTLTIGARDETGGVFAALKAHISALDKQVAVFDKLMTSAGKVAAANDPMIASIAASEKALLAERAALVAVGEGMAASVTSTEAAAGSQAALATEVSRATEMMVVQGREAVRVSGQIASAQRRQAAAVRESGAMGQMLPFAGPGILEGTKKAIEEGATLEEQIAKLKGAGATDAEIAKARADFIEFSKTHSGVVESEYLAGAKDARMIAPAEQFEMALLGGRYRAGARNSGVPVTEADVGNVMRAMDELGLKSMPEREHFLDNILRMQQAFGSQISTETYLAAIRHGKQSVYDWSPEFRDKYFPTLLQSQGEQGGTAMMTAFNNYIGQHMQQSELKALANAGFVRNQDLLYDKIGNVKGLKQGAELFEADTFKSNIVQWSWDLHDEFMKRKGATEKGFDELVAKMPRNMAGLIMFNEQNRARLQRDAASLDKPAGLGAESDSFLAANPVAALGALRDSISQLGASLTSEASRAAGPALVALGHDIQTFSGMIEEVAKKHPHAAAAAETGGILGAIAGGLYLTAKMFGAVKGWLGLGGAPAGGAATGAAEAAGGGLLSGLGRFVWPLGGALMAKQALDAADPAGNLWGLTTPIDRWLAGGGQAPAGVSLPVKALPLDPGVLERARRSEAEWRQDPEAAHGRAMMAHQVGVNVSGEAKVEGRLDISIDPSPLFQAMVSRIQSLDVTFPLVGSADTGRMDTDAEPRRTGGIGHQ